MNPANDERFMRLALAEAEKGVGHTSPNPAVGAILVSKGAVIARGHHRGSGQPHAEVECLRASKQPIPKDAVLFVTLEPCSTTGRTPPCTRSIIDANIREVVIGAIDVNPIHFGRAVGALQSAGIQVRSGVLAQECGELNEAFNHWIRLRRPFVIAKCGMSLDGRLTRAPGETRWITSPAARRHANQFRNRVDAILVGAETVRSDNPRLTVRSMRGARQPWRVVVTRSGRLPASSHLLTDWFATRTLVFGEQPLEVTLAALGEREITSVLIEGGGDVLGQALDARLVNRVQIYLAPIVTGGPVIAFSGQGAATTAEGVRLQGLSYERIGGDIFLTGKSTYDDAISE
jgi:diaminohydroxyphosphoribosylaminopyrimidine deaminase/5-amino-6-(5-phosphoribosylamino)uracil reductase